MMKFNLRSALKRRNSPSGNPMEYDKQLMELMDWLDIIKTNDVFEQWRRQFLDRFKDYMGETGSESAAKAYEGFRGKVDGLVDAVGKLVQHFNEGSMSHKKIAVKSRSAVNDVAKNCQIINIELFGLAPATAAEETMSGYNKYHMSYILIQDDFLEYDRLNICKDVMRDLRDLALDDVADRQVLSAMDEFSRAINRFFSLIQDLGVHRIISKSRELSPVKIPKELILDVQDETVDTTTLEASGRSDGGIGGPLDSSAQLSSVLESPKGKKSGNVRKLPESSNDASRDPYPRRPALTPFMKRDSTRLSVYVDDPEKDREKKKLPLRVKSDKVASDVRNGTIVRKTKTNGTVKKEAPNEALTTAADTNSETFLSNEGILATDRAEMGTIALTSKKKKKPISRVRGDDDDNRSVVSISSKKKAKLKAVRAAKGKKINKPGIKDKKDLIRKHRMKPAPKSDLSDETKPLALAEDSHASQTELELKRDEMDSTHSLLPDSISSVFHTPFSQPLSVDPRRSILVNPLLPQKPIPMSSAPPRNKVSEKRRPAKPMSFSGRTRKQSAKPQLKTWPESLLDRSSDHSTDELVFESLESTDKTEESFTSANKISSDSTSSSNHHDDAEKLSLVQEYTKEGLTMPPRNLKKGPRLWDTDSEGENTSDDTQEVGRKRDDGPPESKSEADEDSTRADVSKDVKQSSMRPREVHHRKSSLKLTSQSEHSGSQSSSHFLSNSQHSRSTVSVEDSQTSIPTTGEVLPIPSRNRNKGPRLWDKDFNDENSSDDMHPVENKGDDGPSESKSEASEDLTRAEESKDLKQSSMRPREVHHRKSSLKLTSQSEHRGRQSSSNFLSNSGHNRSTVSVEDSQTSIPTTGEVLPIPSRNRNKGPRLWDKDFNDENSSDDTHPVENKGDDGPSESKSEASEDLTRAEESKDLKQSSMRPREVHHRKSSLKLTSQSEHRGRQSSSNFLSNSGHNRSTVSVEDSETSLPTTFRSPTLKKPTTQRSVAPRKKDTPAYSVGHKLDRSTNVTRTKAIMTSSAKPLSEPATPLSQAKRPPFSLNDAVRPVDLVCDDPPLEQARPSDPPAGRSPVKTRPLSRTVAFSATSPKDLEKAKPVSLAKRSAMRMDGTLKPVIPAFDGPLSEQASTSFLPENPSPVNVRPLSQMVTLSTSSPKPSEQPNLLSMAKDSPKWMGGSPKPVNIALEGLPSEQATSSSSPDVLSPFNVRPLSRIVPMSTPKPSQQVELLSLAKHPPTRMDGSQKPVENEFDRPPLEQGVAAFPRSPVNLRPPTAIATLSTRSPKPIQPVSLKLIDVFDDGPVERVVPASLPERSPSKKSSLALDAIVSDGEEQHDLFLDESAHSFLSLNSSNHKSHDKDAVTRIGKQMIKKNIPTDAAKGVLKKKKDGLIVRTKDDSSAVKINKSLRKKGNAAVGKAASKDKKKQKPTGGNEGRSLTGWINPFDVAAGEHHFDIGTC